MKKYIQNLRKSKTIRIALLKKIGGTVTIIAANMGYFESSLTPVIFGSITIVLGVIDYHIRTVTTKAL